MNRQPTLAEILADDTGTIRQEVADLLLEPRARQAQAEPRVGHRPQPIDNRVWILFILLILVLAFIENAIKYFNTSKPAPVEVDEIKKFYKQSTLPIPASVPRVHTTGRVNDYTTIPIPAPEPRVNKTGRVIGYSVNIRMQPNLQGEIIKEVNQNEVLNVISFADGWYKIALSEQSRGYIFGAYLIPQNFTNFPYQAVVTKKHQVKMLVKEEGFGRNILAILPDGQTTWILKNDVETHK